MSLFFTWILRIWRYASAHIFISIAVLAVVFGGGWYVLSQMTAASAEARYVLGTALRGTVAASVSASGQVSASHQIDLKPEASGKVIYVGVKAGQAVKAGQLLVRLDSGDASYQLESAKIEYEDLLSPDQSDLRDAQNTAQQAQSDLDSSYTSALSAIGDASTDMDNVVVGLEDLYKKSGGYLSSQKSSQLSSIEKQYRQKAEDAWYDAQASLEDFKKEYSALSADSSRSLIESVLSGARETATQVATAAKYAQDAVTYIRDHDSSSSSAGDDAYTSVTSLASVASGDVSSLVSAAASVQNDKSALNKATNDLKDLEDGPSVTDRRSAELSVRQKAAALSDYSVYAPFDGMIASVAAQVGDAGSSGTAALTIITAQQIAKVSLNEVDAVKVKAGQKATLTFDAIDELSLTGTVAQVDVVGVVEQGVVSYTVDIALDAQDSRIKPGMTVNASIKTDIAQDVLVVPASAVKTAQGQSYVLVFNPAIDEAVAAAGGTRGVTSATAPVQVPVEVGIQGDTKVEIVSGLDEGQQIVTRTISASSAAASSAGGTGGNSAGGVGGTMPAGAVMRSF